MANNAESAFHCTYSPKVPEILHELGCSLIVSTYQAGKVIILSVLDNHRIIQLPRDFKKAMGLAVDGRKIAVACQNKIEVLANAEKLAPNYPNKPNTYDSLFLPRATYYTGELDIHDMHWVDEKLTAVSTRLSCIATIEEDYSVKPIWQPNFITSIIPVDKCHLNGMAVYNGEIMYASAFGKSDIEKGWRENILKNGIIIDVKTNEIVCEGLPMPHSPRVYDGQLIFLLSGTGELVEMDVDSGRIEVVTRFKGFARGMCKWGDYLFVGLSRFRKNSTTFRELNIKAKKLECGIDIVHLPTGMIVGNLRYSNDVQELYDIQILHGNGRTGILNPEMNFHEVSINLPNKDFWVNE
jgi:uncharacterized protein (TIGR03032 family)